ncbi:MAG: 50S ribosomal protein L3 [Erysipelotrichaceae bacterium]
MKGILGRKSGMTQVFTQEGVLVPVTVIEVEPNVLLQKKTIENDGYVAVQLGLENIKESRATKPHLGHVAKAKTGAKRYIREIRSEQMANDYEVGAIIAADLFAAGDYVDVQGTSKGKGFTGAVVRNNQKLGPASHGSMHHRGVGSLATGGITSRKGKIDKGRVMAGQEGGFTTTNQGLEVIKVDTEKNYILVKGNVPGPNRGLLTITSTVKRMKNTEAVSLVDYSSMVETSKNEAPQVEEAPVETAAVVEGE